MSDIEIEKAYNKITNAKTQRTVLKAVQYFLEQPERSLKWHINMYYRAEQDAPADLLAFAEARMLELR